MILTGYFLILVNVSTALISETVVSHLMKVKSYDCLHEVGLVG